MIRTLRALFLGRLLREKLLLVAFTLIGLAWWGSAFLGRLSSFSRSAHRTTVELAEQKQWLDNRVAIDQAGQKAAARLDPTLTYDALRLVAEVGTIASQNGLRNTSSGAQTTESNGQFSVHTIQFNVTQADWESLKKFCEALQKRVPYIAIKEFSLMANQTNPAQLNLQLRVSSVEIVR